MRYIVYTDYNHYIDHLDKALLGVKVPREIVSSKHLTCYQYIDGKFIFDEHKKEKLEKSKYLEQEISKFKLKLSETDYI